MTEYELMKYFAGSLAYEMKYSRTTREDLMKETGLSKSAISRYLNGERLPTIKNLINLSIALACDLEDLLDTSEYID